MVATMKKLMIKGDWKMDLEIMIYLETLKELADRETKEFLDELLQEQQALV